MEYYNDNSNYSMWSIIAGISTQRKKTEGKYVFNFYFHLSGKFYVCQVNTTYYVKVLDTSSKKNQIKVFFVKNLKCTISTLSGTLSKKSVISLFDVAQGLISFLVILWKPHSIIITLNQTDQLRIIIYKYHLKGRRYITSVMRIIAAKHMKERKGTLKLKTFSTLSKKLAIEPSVSCM